MSGCIAWELLPRELLLRIFAALRIRDLAAAQACRRWRHIADSNHVWAARVASSLNEAVDPNIDLGQLRLKHIAMMVARDFPVRSTQDFISYPHNPWTQLYPSPANVLRVMRAGLLHRHAFITLSGFLTNAWSVAGVYDNSWMPAAATARRKILYGSRRATDLERLVEHTLTVCLSIGGLSCVAFHLACSFVLGTFLPSTWSSSTALQSIRAAVMALSTGALVGFAAPFTTKPFLVSYCGGAAFFIGCAALQRHLLPHSGWIYIALPLICSLVGWARQSLIGGFCVGVLLTVWRASLLTLLFAGACSYVTTAAYSIAACGFCFSFWPKRWRAQPGSFPNYPFPPAALEQD